MATYNGEKYIAEQIQSLLTQTEVKWKLYVHDDGSTDHTRVILEDYARRYPERIYVLDGPSCGGAKNNFFYLLRNVRAPYIMFCDQDDVWLPEKIALSMKQMRELEEQKGEEKPLLIFSDLCVVDRNLKTVAERMSTYQKLDPEHIRTKDLMVQNVITGCTVMINRTLAEMAAQPEKTGDIIMHDWWCALLAACFGGISYIDRALILYRQHGDNSIGAKNISSISYACKKLQYYQEIGESLRMTRRQAAFFFECYAAANPILYEYGGIGSKGKRERFRFYVKNGIRKSGWQRSLGLIIWG